MAQYVAPEYEQNWGNLAGLFGHIQNENEEAEFNQETEVIDKDTALVHFINKICEQYELPKGVSLVVKRGVFYPSPQLEKVVAALGHRLLYKAIKQAVKYLTTQRLHVKPRCINKFLIVTMCKHAPKESESL